jgi:hypothetical protein
MDEADLKFIWILVRYLGLGISLIGFIQFGKIIGIIGLLVLFIGILWEVLYKKYYFDKWW